MVGKGEKTGLGRALVKAHNNMIQENKDKGRFYKSINKKSSPLISITDITDIDAVIQQSEEADRDFSNDNLHAHLLTDLDSSSSTSALTSEERRELQKKEEARHAGSLRVPRRPLWNSDMTVDELDVNEKQAFLTWRRGLAQLEENDNLVLTPFEKNLDIWRQLWRVVERSELLVMVVDARNPLFYRCLDLEAYAREVDEHKRTMLLINKADLLPYSIRKKWAEYFHDQGILYVFWSAKAASAVLEGKKLGVTKDVEDTTQESEEELDTKVYGRDELLARLQFEAEEIMKLRVSTPKSTGPSKYHSPVRKSGAKPSSVTVGFVGYPNVGKSSTINALVGEKRAGVTSTPGKTKHFQTLIISDKLTLCDCPGLVFPSFTSSRHEMIACGVLPIDRITAHRDAVQVVADRVPRHVIESTYKISLPKPKPYEPQSRPPLAFELLRSYCASRGYRGSRGLPDETRAARQILKDYIDGKLIHFQLPPGMSADDDNTYAPFGVSNEAAGSSLPDIDEEDLSEIEEDISVDDNVETSADLEDVMNDLISFDLANGLASDNKADAKKKPLKAPHKLHKKTQRVKNRSWRVGNDGGDGMPLARVFQKPVNRGTTA